MGTRVGVVGERVKRRQAVGSHGGCHRAPGPRPGWGGSSVRRVVTSLCSQVTAIVLRARHAAEAALGVRPRKVVRLSYVSVGMRPPWPTRSGTVVTGQFQVAPMCWRRGRYRDRMGRRLSSSWVSGPNLSSHRTTEVGRPSASRETREKSGQGQSGLSEGEEGRGRRGSEAGGSGSGGGREIGKRQGTSARRSRGQGAPCPM